LRNFEKFLKHAAKFHLAERVGSTTQEAGDGNVAPVPAGVMAAARHSLTCCHHRLTLD